MMWCHVICIVHVFEEDNRSILLIRVMNSIGWMRFIQEKRFLLKILFCLFLPDLLHPMLLHPILFSSVPSFTAHFNLICPILFHLIPSFSIHFILISSIPFYSIKSRPFLSWFILSYPIASYLVISYHTFFTSLPA